MSVAQARITLGAALKIALPNFNVFPAPGGASDEISRPTLQLERTRVDKLPEAPQGVRQHTFSLYVIAPQHAGEDALDGYLDDVLEALDESTSTRWEGASRAAYSESNACYEITLTTTSTRN